MAQIQEILKKEQERDDGDSRQTIHLFQEGTFYRAYEWSAWLCHRYISRFKVTKRKLKNIEQPVLFIGFPLTSLQKYTPEGGDVVVTGEKTMDLLLPDTMVPDDMTADMMQADFEQWKESIPLAEPSKKRESEALADGETPMFHSGITGIMHRVLAFPIENKTPMQCMAFLADIKQQLAELI
jgi:hypothetical protein